MELGRHPGFAPAVSRRHGRHSLVSDSACDERWPEYRPSGESQRGHASVPERPGPGVPRRVSIRPVIHEPPRVGRWGCRGEARGSPILSRGWLPTVRRRGQRAPEHRGHGQWGPGRGKPLPPRQYPFRIQTKRYAPNRSRRLLRHHESRFRARSAQSHSVCLARDQRPRQPEAVSCLGHSWGGECDVRRDPYGSRRPSPRLLCADSLVHR